MQIDNTTRLFEVGLKLRTETFVLSHRILLTPLLEYFCTVNLLDWRLFISVDYRLFQGCDDLTIV